MLIECGDIKVPSILSWWVHVGGLVVDQSLGIQKKR